MKTVPSHNHGMLTGPHTVQNIEYLVHERGISDMFLGLILVPLVEKLAEHLTAIDEAWDNQVRVLSLEWSNFADDSD